MSLTPLNVFCAGLPSIKSMASAGQAEEEKVLSGFLADRGEEYGLVLKGPELWHTGAAGIPGVGRLGQGAIFRLSEILSQTSPEGADYALAEALSGKLVEEGAGPGAGFFSKGIDGRLKITPAGFKGLLERLGRVGGPGLSAVVPEDAGGAARIDGIESRDLDVLRAMAAQGEKNFGKYFDGSNGSGRGAESAAVKMERGQRDVLPAAAQYGSKAATNAVPALPASGEQTASWRPPDNLKGRLARVAGAVAAGAGIGGISFLLWGPASAAYYLTGSIMKSVSYNADVFEKAADKIRNVPPVRFLAENGLVKKAYNATIGPVARAVMETDSSRLFLGLGLTLGGMATGNPIMTYFGMTFGILNAGEMVSKAVFTGASRLLERPEAAKLGKSIDSAAHAAFGDTLKGSAGNAGDNGTGGGTGIRAKARAALKKAADAAYDNRGTLAKTAVAAAVTIAVMSGFAIGTHAALGNTLGRMTEQPGDLTPWDKAKNSVIGGYRLYNPSGTVLKGGENTSRFYSEMKAKYGPATPDDWAAVIEKEITWVAHNDLYGTNMYYISSEEAAKLTTLNNVAGRYSDCTGKAALMYNMLKLDGFGQAEVVVGVAPLGYEDKVGHAWIAVRDASGKPGEIFHYSNTQHLLRAETFTEADGIKGDNMAAFIAGGAGGLATEGIYGLLEKLEKKAEKAYGMVLKTGRAAAVLPAAALE